MREGSYDDSVGLGSCTGDKAEIKVSVNFEVDRLKKKKMMKKSAV